LEKKLQRARRDDILITGGEHNSSVGPKDGENCQPGAAVDPDKNLSYAKKA